ncbi:MAG TPA: hypothetical protein VNI81_04810 [Candidatus Limnocylindrales bacterium]|nr:hypothetical protein [Candidatus Limnocylindrales bacterium]
MKNLGTSNSLYRITKTNRNLIFWFVLAAVTLSLLTAIHALPAQPVRLFLPAPFVSSALSTSSVHASRQIPGQTYTPTAEELVAAVVTNELADREQLRKWICMVEKRVGKETLTEELVETSDGPLYRLLAIDGAGLNPTQRQQDDARLSHLLHDPSLLLKLKQAQDDDEIKLQKLLSMMPHAFLYDYDGAEESLLRIKFRPDPGYTPPTYEARVIHSLAGTILIDSERNRLAKVVGHLLNRVEFGFGLLGRIDTGSVEFARVEVGPQQWKTALINIHFSGRAVLFKTISKDQYERRSDFRLVPSNLSLSDAMALLVSRVFPTPQTPKTGH